MADFKPAYKVMNVELIELCNKIFDSKDDSEVQKKAKRDFHAILTRQHPEVKNYHYEKRAGDYFITIDAKHQAGSSGAAKPDSPFRRD